jgi:hypothetical protein
MTILELTPESPAGTYEVLTSSGSRYVVQVGDEVTSTRVPDAVSSVEWYLSKARYRDAEPLVCTMMRFVVGGQGVMQYVKEERRDDPEYVASTRLTTPVTGIRLIPAE